VDGHKSRTVLPGEFQLTKGDVVVESGKACKSEVEKEHIAWVETGTWSLAKGFWLFHLDRATFPLNATGRGGEGALETCLFQVRNVEARKISGLGGSN
jgi:hypothetical protein